MNAPSTAQVSSAIPEQPAQGHSQVLPSAMGTSWTGEGGTVDSGGGWSQQPGSGSLWCGLGDQWGEVGDLAGNRVGLGGLLGEEDGIALK